MFQLWKKSTVVSILQGVTFLAAYVLDGSSWEIAYVIASVVALPAYVLRWDRIGFKKNDRLISRAVGTILGFAMLRLLTSSPNTVIIAFALQAFVIFTAGDEARPDEFANRFGMPQWVLRAAPLPYGLGPISGFGWYLWEQLIRR